MESIAARESQLLAPYAMHSADSAGRKHPEPSHPYRGPFQRDRDRIVHSAAYRRLSYKTQVFTGEMGDYHRSRLTHTLETTSIARTLGRALRLNEDLIEALALLHDIGHPPFGHAGEDTLNECLQEHGGFSHNRHALTIAEELESRYPDFPGLNLSIEVLDGQTGRVHKTRENRSLLESQVVDAADSVAYDTHDADDAMELNLLELDELCEIPLWRQAAIRVRGRWAALDPSELRRAILHELIDWQVGDLLEQTQQRIHAHRIDSVQTVRSGPHLVQASDELAPLKQELEAFLYERVYRHPDVLPMRSRAQGFLRKMFDGFVHQPELLPEKFQSRAEAVGVERAAGDYLAGMTDRYAQREYERLFASTRKA